MKWSLQVFVDSVEVTSKLTGTLRVEAEESTARIASFTYQPSPGPVDVKTLTNVPVQIDFIDDPGGSPVTTRLFSGWSNQPVYDPSTGLVRFECYDGLQVHFESMTEAQVVAAISGGRYSTEIFGSREDGWQQALDVLSTVAAGYDLNRDGVTATQTPWSAKPVADRTFTVSGIIDGSVEVDLARTRDLHNKTIIGYEYRFTRLHHREHSFAWAWPADFCTYFDQSHELPTRDMVDGAAAGAGWAIKNRNIGFETLPDSGTYCGGTAAWTISEELQNQLVTQANWTAIRRWSQTVTESYTLTVQEAGSITLLGPQLAEDSAGVQTEYDDAGWDASTETDIPPGFTPNVLGDYVDDQDDRTVGDNAVETMLAVARTSILAAHRKNYLAVDVPIVPDIERSETVRIEAGRATGQGKVFQTTHSIDIASGRATTNIRIACSKCGPGGFDDQLAAPTPPNTQPVHAPPSSSTGLPSRIGNDDTVPNFDETWTGFTGNYTVAVGTPSPEQIYPRRFRVETPDIEDESRNERQAAATQTYNVLAPDEELTVGA